MPTTPDERRVGELMAEVYRSGGRFVMDAEKTRLAVRGVSDDLKAQAFEDRHQIIEVLTGDPLDGIGWGVRDVFFEKCCEYIDSQIPMGTVADQRAQKAMYNSTWYEPLSKLHLNGQFEQYRQELLRFANRVISYAHGSQEEAPAFVG